MNEVVQRFSKISADNNRFPVALNSIELLQKNLFEFQKLSMNDLQCMEKSNDIHKQSIHDIFIEFKKENDKELKQNNVLTDCLKLYYKFFNKHRYIINQIMFNAHKELKLRTDFAAKLVKNLQKKKMVNDISAETKDKLSLDSGIMHETLKQADYVVHLSQYSAKIEKEFLNELKMILNHSK